MSIDYGYLAELLYPEVTQTPEDMEKKFPERKLPEGAKVTRFAPSPTGFLHLGGVFQAMVDERLAHQSGGVFMLRIEDTDSKREIKDAAEKLICSLAHYGIRFDEGVTVDGEVGDYGPYRQSRRAFIYHVYAKKLVSEGKAYPCFVDEDELEKLRTTDKKAEIKSKDWHEDDPAKRREERDRMRIFTVEEVEANLKAGKRFVLRILADGDPEKKTPISDIIRGKLEIPENDEDFVLLKNDGIPTYHFAHAVDDHLMRTTHVIRGEEWLPSLAKHIQLFRYLGFKLPKYMHTAQIMKLENGSKKKLSKRDMGFTMDDYSSLGYAPECVREYVMTLLNSNFDDWRLANPTAPLNDFKFAPNKMSPSGCLFDKAKLDDISRNVISRMSADDVYTATAAWAKDNDQFFYEVITRDPDYTKRILSIGRGGKKPRKDIKIYSGVSEYIGFFFDEYYRVDDWFPETVHPADVKAVLRSFMETYDPADDQNTWFDKIKAIAENIGYASDMKKFREEPGNYRGHIGDVSMFIRLAITGHVNSPDLYEVMQILGREKSVMRIVLMLDLIDEID